MVSNNYVSSKSGCSQLIYPSNKTSNFKTYVLFIVIVCSRMLPSLMHSLPITWQFHQVYHTEISMNTSTACRFHIVEVILSNFHKLFLIWLLGIKPSYLLFYEIFLAIELIFHHSNWAFYWKLDKLFSYIIVTPNLHRLHHSQSFKDTQYNYASILTIWDKLFHTCSYPKYPEKIQLGLTEYNNHLNIINLIFLPLTKHW